MSGNDARVVVRWTGLAAATAALLGIGVVLNPQVSFVLLVALLASTALAAPAAAWVLAALVAALIFKALVSLGLLPSAATFIDLPLAWGALFVALTKSRERPPLLRRHLRWLAALGLAVMLAWAFNPSEILRPIVYFMLLAEPFAIVGALLADPPSPRLRRTLECALLALVLIQIPVVILQVALYGAPSDRIQGTLYLAGAGAHVISAVAVVGAIWILAGAAVGQMLGVLRLPVVVALFVIPFLADARQVIVALPVMLLATRFRGRPAQLFARTALIAGSVIVLFTIIPAGTSAERYIEQARSGKGGKEATALFVWRKLEGDPASLVFGKGPAQTVSRAAFMTTDLSRKPEAPLAALGLKPAPIAIEAQSKVLAVSHGGTSFNSGTSSTLGVLGDLGILGVLVYSGLLLSLFLRLRTETSPEGVAAAAGFALFIVLGLVFDWWEQPPLGVPLAVLAGLALTRMSDAADGRNSPQTA